MFIVFIRKRAEELTLNDATLNVGTDMTMIGACAEATLVGDTGCLSWWGVSYRPP